MSKVAGSAKRAAAAVTVGCGLVLAGAMPIAALDSTVPPATTLVTTGSGGGLPRFPGGGGRVGRRSTWGRHHGGHWWWWALLALVLLALVAMMIWLSIGHRRAAQSARAVSPTANAEAILAERCARGEITAEEYATARAALRDG